VHVARPSPFITWTSLPLPEKIQRAGADRSLLARPSHLRLCRFPGKIAGLRTRTAAGLLYVSAFPVKRQLLDAGTAGAPPNWVVAGGTGSKRRGSAVGWSVPQYREGRLRHSPEIRGWRLATLEITGWRPSGDEPFEKEPSSTQRWNRRQRPANVDGGDLSGQAQRRTDKTKR
jgi:hypothetical protein